MGVHIQNVIVILTELDSLIIKYKHMFALKVLYITFRYFLSVMTPVAVK